MFEKRSLVHKLNIVDTDVIDKAGKRSLCHSAMTSLQLALGNKKHKKIE